MMVVDLILHYYLCIIMILTHMKQQHELSSVGYKNNLIRFYIKADVTSYAQLLLQAVILAFYLGLIVSYVVISKVTYSMETLNQLGALKQAMSLIYVALITFLQIPLLEIIIGTIFIDYQSAIDKLNIGGLDAQDLLDF